jgi:hypothetical protein
MNVNVFIYTKCEGLAGTLKDSMFNTLNSSNSAYSIQTSGDSQQASTIDSSHNTERKPTQLLINYTVKYGS